MFFQVTVHSVGQLDIWLGVRSKERRRTESTAHENVPISTRPNESKHNISRDQTKRSPYRATQRNKCELKMGGLRRTKKYIFINQTMSHMQLFRRITTKFVKNNKGTTSKNYLSVTIMFPNYQCITATVSKMCETFTYIVRSHSTVWLTCHSFLATSLPSCRSVNG